jgi:hypothetical protein
MGNSCESYCAYEEQGQMNFAHRTEINHHHVSNEKSYLMSVSSVGGANSSFNNGGRVSRKTVLSNKT